MWLADHHGLTVSTDSSVPLLATTRRDTRKAGLRAPTCRGNVAWWRRAVASLRASPHYREPRRPARQLELRLFPPAGAPIAASQVSRHVAERTDEEAPSWMVERT
jgi:hypothetical protein